jgi:arylsulfatase A-like enzyme
MAGAIASLRRSQPGIGLGAEDVIRCARTGADFGWTPQRVAHYDGRCRLRRAVHFGGVIPTPTLDRIAAEGLRYTSFHSTGLCSPSRAAIITGRNHHSVGFGVVSEIATGFPGYDSIVPIDKSTIGTILKANGYATAWFGEDHNTPSYQSSQAGPFDQWPTRLSCRPIESSATGTPAPGTWRARWVRGSLPRSVPLRERAPGDLHSVALEDLLQPIQRQMIRVLGDDHVRQ